MLQVAPLQPSLSAPVSTDIDTDNHPAQDIDQYFRHELIYKRNRRMGERIVELLMSRPHTSFFFAFGAGELMRAPLRHFFGTIGSGIPDPLYRQISETGADYKKEMKRPLVGSLGKSVDGSQNFRLKSQPSIRSLTGRVLSRERFVEYTVYFFELFSVVTPFLVSKRCIHIFS